MKTVAVLFGGSSAEHDVSIITGQYVISQLRKIGHAVVPVYIGHSAVWYCGEELGSLAFFEQGRVSEGELAKYAGWKVSTNAGVLELSRTKGLRSQKYQIDMVFPALHGTNGEDGALQGYCQFLNVPYAGTAMEGSVVAMNKIFTKQVLNSAGIATPSYVWTNRYDWHESQEEVLSRVEQELQYPVFVKPPHAGSSIGVSCATSRQELIQGIKLALHYDTHCLIEQGIIGARDITVAVLGNTQLQTSVPQESHAQEGMLSYEDKYINDGGAQFGGSDEVMTIPANINAQVEKDIMSLAKKVYTILGLEGTSRVDFLLDESENITVIEVNPLPGTLYNHLWEKSGVSGTELVQRMIDLGFESYAARNEVEHDFNSSILQHANNMKLKV